MFVLLFYFYQMLSIITKNNHNGHMLPYFVHLVLYCLNQTIKKYHVTSGQIHKNPKHKLQCLQIMMKMYIAI